MKALEFLRGVRTPSPKVEALPETAEIAQQVEAITEERGTLREQLETATRDFHRHVEGRSSSMSGDYPPLIELKIRSETARRALQTYRTPGTVKQYEEAETAWADRKAATRNAKETVDRLTAAMDALNERLDPLWRLQQQCEARDRAAAAAAALKKALAEAGG